MNARYDPQEIYEDVLKKKKEFLLKNPYAKAPYEYVVDYAKEERYLNAVIFGCHLVLSPEFSKEPIVRRAVGTYEEDIKVKVDYKLYRKLNRKNLKEKHKKNPFWKSKIETFTDGIKTIFLGFAILIMMILFLILLPWFIFKRYTEIIWLPWYYTLRLKLRLLFRRKKWLKDLKHAPESEEFSWIIKERGIE